MQTIVFQLGLQGYAETWAFQKQLHERVVTDQKKAYLVCVQHHDVITLGKHATSDYLLLNRAQYGERSIDLVEIDRGGEVTAHNPGQLVVYPILSVRELALSPKRYVALLESIVIDLLAQFGVRANTDTMYPGVWVGKKKICALGIRIKNRVTLHGFALNVNNDLDIFSTIVPCGISSRGVTSLSEVIGNVSLEEVNEALYEVWQARVGKIEEVRRLSLLNRLSF